MGFLRFLVGCERFLVGIMRFLLGIRKFKWDLGGFSKILDVIVGFMRFDLDF